MENNYIQELYDYLNSQEFQNTEGNVFYNYYIYQYPAAQEYKMRSAIQDFKERLQRPTNYVNVMTLDLFQVFCDYLKGKNFGSVSYLEDTFELDKTNPDAVTTELTTDANSEEFIKYVNQLIINFMQINDGLKKPYVFIYGIGKIYPYLRTNVFLTRYERYNDTSLYKIILFYPGHQEGNSFSLFDEINNRNYEFKCCFYI